MSKAPGMLSAGRPSSKKDSKKAATLASLSDDRPKKRVNFDLPADEHAKLKVYAARQGKTVKDILTEYIAQLPSE